MSLNPFAEPFEPDHQTVVERRGGQVVVRKSGSSPAARHHLAHEAAVLARARRPGVVDLVDHHDDGHEATLVTAWVGTHTLATMTVRSVEQVAGLVAVLADTVEALHLLGIIHGRITPEHVVLDGQGYPVLVGFGAASLDGDADKRFERADDVAALGRLLSDLLDAVPPEGVTGRPRGSRRRRTALAELARQAMAEDRWARPSAHRLAVGILSAVPGARPVDPTGSSDGPTGTDPTAARPVPVPPAASAAPAGADAAPPPPSPPDAPPTLTYAGPPSQLVEASDDPEPSDVTTAGAPPAGDGDVEPDVPGQSLEPAAAPAPVPLRDTIQLARERPGRSAAVARPVAAEDEASSSRRIPLAAAVAGAAALAVVTAGATFALTRPDEPPVPPVTELAGPTTVTAAPTTAPAPPTTASPAAPGAARMTTVDNSGVVTHQGARYEIGRPGDETTIGDFRCTGTVTAVTLDPATGEVWSFDGWSEGNENLPARVVAHVPAGSHLVPSVIDGRGCSTLSARRPDGTVFGVALPPPTPTTTARPGAPA